MLRLALGLEGSPLAGGVDVVGGGWAADLLAAAAEVATDAGRRARRVRRRAPQLPGEALAWLGFLDSAGLGGCLALDMGLGKTPTMLAHLLAGDGRRARARDRAARGRRQLDGRSRALHARACASSCTTARAAPRADEIAAEVADADVVVTTYGTAVRDVDALADGRVGARRARRGAGDQEPGQRHVAAAAPHPGAQPHRAHRYADRERSRRPLGDPRLRQSRPRRSAPAVHRAPVERRHRDARRGRRRDARAQRHPRVPPHQGRAEIAAELPDQIDELDHCAMTPEQIGMYQALLDTLVTGTDARRGREAAQGSDPRRDHRAQADLQPPVGVPARRPTARRSLGQARPARRDRRRGVRGRRDACSCSRTSRSGACGSPSTSPSAPARRSRATTAACRAPRATSIVDEFQSGEGAGRARALVEGRRHRPEPHRRESRRALRPLVEPRGRRPGARPRVAHRPDPHRHLPPADLSGHRRRAGRGGRRRQAPHRRSRAAEVELARRPRQRPAARRARHPSRRGAHRRPAVVRGRGVLA